MAMINSKFIFFIFMPFQIFSSTHYFPCQYSWPDLMFRYYSSWSTDYDLYYISKKSGLVFIGVNPLTTKNARSKKCEEAIKNIFYNSGITGKHFEITSGYDEPVETKETKITTISSNVKEKLWNYAKQQKMSIQCSGSNLKCKAYTTKELEKLGFTKDKYPRID